MPACRPPSRQFGRATRGGDSSRGPCCGEPRPARVARRPGRRDVGHAGGVGRPGDAPRFPRRCCDSRRRRAHRARRRVALDGPGGGRRVAACAWPAARRRTRGSAARGRRRSGRDREGSAGHRHAVRHRSGRVDWRAPPRAHERAGRLRCASCPRCVAPRAIEHQGCAPHSSSASSQRPGSRP